jgi:hypothetical protein
MISRRSFLIKGIELSSTIALASSYSGCSPKIDRRETLKGPNHTLGHKLRMGTFPKPTQVIKTEVAIVGGGVSGLAAARILKQRGIEFKLIELEDKVGGNSHSDKNSVSSYPLGAHYLPIPGSYDKDLLSFLEEENVITGYENGKPIYNEYYLCFDPKERLYINNHWQEGIIPVNGIDRKSTEDFDKFYELVKKFKALKGSDGKEAFCIPLHFCSDDPSIKKLDTITFEFFIQQHKLSSPFLLWYLNYCCADDFGGTISTISAWAGIHYFCSRKGSASNAQPDAVLTWPEGNGWLVNKLMKYAVKETTTNSMVFQVGYENGKCIVDYFDAIKEESIRLVSEKVILATPQFINQRILSGTLERKIDYAQFFYAPWMVANITCSNHLEEKRGERLSWDNVIYGSKSLGYVNSNHQNIQLFSDRQVITYYLPLTGADSNVERKLSHQRSFKDWYELVIEDLKLPHPTIEQSIQEVDIWLWGHGMIRPSVNFISKTSLDASASIGQKIFFVHTDTSGISIFEQAFFVGTQTAKMITA